MKKWWVLFCVLELALGIKVQGASFLTPGFLERSGATIPGGMPTPASTPARRASGIQLGILGEIPAAGVDYQKYRLAAEWGNGVFRMGTFFEVSGMDSIYRSVAGNLEAACARSFWILGLGHSYQVDWVPGEDSWSRKEAKGGVSVLFPAGFSAGVLSRYSYESLPDFFAGIHWKASEAYLIFAEFGKNEFHIGHEILLGSIRIQTAYRYPGPQILFEIGFHIGSVFAAAGTRQTATSLTAYPFRVHWK
ncbi:MAG: hypothetical protein LBR60_01840 [Fibrobacter sp.]|jgi:hypothetical protein|nr:hypothetical protein [Fibrobacter sp.]